MDLGDVAELLAAAGTLAAVWVAARALRRTRDIAFDQARSVRLGHMHTLFRDYLQREFDFQLAEVRGENSKEAASSLRAFKMYTMEEMWLWLEAERRHVPTSDVGRFEHRRLIRGWDATIRYHLQRGSRRELIEFLKARRCYSPGFVRLVRLAHPARRRVPPPKPPAYFD